MAIHFLNEDLFFPTADHADSNGILAVGGDLSEERLLLAYSQGVFPWFNPGEPILWWTPDPRFVLYPHELKIHKSMRPYFNQQKYKVTVDTCFEEVMRNCKTSRRKGQYGGSWITEDMVAAYSKLNQKGLAHSVEVWKDKDLVGGLYGIALGKVFFGESMFAKASNASKFGFITLVKKLTEWEFDLIDCQQETEHLASLGARSIRRVDFLKHLKENEQHENKAGSWTTFFE